MKIIQLLLSKKGCVFLLGFWVSNMLFSQKLFNIYIYDKESHLPLQGVTIVEAGKKNKLKSSEKGHFTIALKKDTNELLFTHIGYLPLKLTIIKFNVKDTIYLTRKIEQLSDVVVVTGYGILKRKDLIANISTVKGKDVAYFPVQSFESDLAGKATGVQITVPNGVLNNPPVFRIRGTNSISNNAQPLIVIDGVPTYTGNYSYGNAPANPLASINPEDIESFDIAKDGDATAIYGSRAANGVVFITTKKGKSGKPKISLSSWAGVNQPNRLPELLNAQEYLKIKKIAIANSNPANAGITFTPQKNNDSSLIDTRWYDYIYQNGFTQSHVLSVNGGNENINYYISSGFTNQNGIIQKNQFQRLNFLANVDAKINKYISSGVKVAYSNELNKAATSSGSLNGEAFGLSGLGRLPLVLPPILSPYLNNGNYNLNGATIGQPGITGTAITFPNPVVALDLNYSNNEVNHIQSLVYINIQPFEGFNIKSQYGIDNLNIDNNIYQSPLSADGFGSKGNATSVYLKNSLWVWTNTLSYAKNIKYHQFSILLGNEQQKISSSSYGLNRQNVSDPNFGVIQAGWTTNNPAGLGYSENYLVSNFGRFLYNYKEKYFFSSNLRQDGYSALGIKTGTFYGVGIGWQISNENFWKHNKIVDYISTLKLRASYGTVGNINGVGDYASLSTYASGIYGGLSTLDFSTVGNSALQWETSSKLDIGIVYGLLNDRVNGELTYYKNNIDGLILAVRQAPSTGLPSAPPLNVGKMYNEGIEFSINANIISTKNFNWNTQFNFSYNENQVTALAGKDLTEIFDGTAGLEFVSKTLPGYSLGYLFLVKNGGVDPETGKRIFLSKEGTKVYYQFYAPAGQFNWSTTSDGKTKYVSPNGATSISSANDGQLIGNVLPKYIGGWTNNFKLNNFELNVLFTYQLDFFIYYGTNAGLHDQRFWNNAKDILTDAWFNPGDQNKKYAKPVWGDNVSNGTFILSDINVFRGDFVKIKNVTLAYNIPTSTLNKTLISNCRFYISAQNLFIFTGYPGPDPEVSTNGLSTRTQGVDRNTVANAQTFTLGFNIVFN